ncbi:MAG: MoaD/ThiS family protein [Alphaproteobacteria bacterium]|jgi:thiamine biosynthesis protein ThiS|nr:MoaD/ThiS family protein [Alphaproteobacteria bacterium]MCK5621728.1 MoaD/ThiS family protein [Alphaproteobacteria bacterium]
MKVTVKMSGMIARIVPGSADGIEVKLLDGATVSSLMTRLGLPGNETYLVIVNDSTVAKDRRGTHKLSDGDRIAIVPPLKGG